MKKVVIIHTSFISMDTLNKLFAEIVPEAKVHNIVDDTLLPEKGDDTLLPSFHPDIYITRVPGGGTRIHTGIALTLQDHIPPSKVREVFRIVGALLYEKTVHAGDLLRSPCPLDYGEDGGQMRTEES